MTLSREGDRLRKIFAEGAPDWLEEYTLKDLSAEQVIDLLDTQTFFELMNTPYPSDRVAVLDRLVRERLIDEINGTYAIRRLGGLLLARKLSAFPDLARKAPRVVVYTGLLKQRPGLTRPAEGDTRWAFSPWSHL